MILAGCIETSKLQEFFSNKKYFDQWWYRYGLAVARPAQPPYFKENMDDLYREVIIEHYKHPGYRGHLDPHDIQFEDNNPLCGDHIEITLRTDDQGNVTDARFDGHGCAISQASADLLIESIIGKSVEDVKKLNKQDILDMLGIDLGPVRLKCALLSLKVLKAGVYGLGEASDSLVE